MPTTTYHDTQIKVRNIGARTDSTGTAVTDLSAEEERFSNILFSRGWIAPSDAFEPVKGGSSTWNVEVGSGVADVDLYVVGGTAIGQGNYVVRLDQGGDTIVVDSSDVSNPRTDEIYLIVQDNAYDSSGLSLARFAYRKGDAGPTAEVPGPDPAWTAYELLATVYVPASSMDILATTLTDERLQSQSTADAPTLDGVAASGYSLTTHDHDADYAGDAHEDSTDGHPDVTTTQNGFMSAADKLKLNAIESLAEVNLTPTEIRSLLVTVDGSGSGLDADQLDNRNITDFATATHIHFGDYYTESEFDALIAPKAWLGEQVDVGRPAAQNTASGLESSPLMYVENRDDWGGHSASNNYIYADGAGYYLVDGRGEWAISTGGSTRQIRITQNSTQIAVGREKPISGRVTLCEASALVYMAASDYVRFYAYQDSGGNLNLNSCNFKLTKLGT